MAEVQAPNASKIIAILIQRLGGGPQDIAWAEFDQFDTSLPTLFTVDQETGTMRCEVMPPRGGRS